CHNADKWNITKLKALIAEDQKNRVKYVLMPNSPFVQNWDLIQIIFLLYVAGVVPFKAGFNYNFSGGMFVIDMLVDVYFMCDIVVCFLTAYENSERLIVVNYWKIAWRYMQGWFVLDFLSVLPTQYATMIADGTFLCTISASCTESRPAASLDAYLKLLKMFRLVRLVKLLRLARFKRILQKYQGETFHLLRILHFSGLCGGMLLMGHICGCAFYFMSTQQMWTPYERELYETGERIPWIAEHFGDDYDSTPVGPRYLSSLYWAFSTMSTVGYGDISSSTFAERTFAIFVIILGTFMFGYIVAQVMSEVDAANQTSMRHRHKLTQVAAYIQDLQLPRELSRDMLGHFREQQDKKYNDQELLFDLPFRLRTRVLAHKYKAIIADVPLLCEGGESFRTELCARLKPVEYLPNHIIYDMDQIAVDVYIISSGKVEFVDVSGGVHCILANGAYFGEGAAIEPNATRWDTARSQSLVYTLKMKARELRDLIISYPTVFQEFKTLYYERKQRLEAWRANNRDWGNARSFKCSERFSQDLKWTRTPSILIKQRDIAKLSRSSKSTPVEPVGTPVEHEQSSLGTLHDQMTQIHKQMNADMENLTRKLQTMKQPQTDLVNNTRKDTNRLKAAYNNDTAGRHSSTRQQGRHGPSYRTGPASAPSSKVAFHKGTLYNGGAPVQA
ncbi:hypothetical protein CYMTET_32330, partial [Cymbomonas tetramitiformis]